MRLVLWVFRAFVLVMSGGSPITSPTFVRGTMDDSVLGTSALEACVLRERSGPLLGRGWGTVHNDWVTSRSSFLGGQEGDFPLKVGVPSFLWGIDIMQIGGRGFLESVFSDGGGFAENLIAEGSLADSQE